MTAKAETLSIRLPDDVKSHVDEIARIRKRSRSFIIKEAIELYVRERAEYARELDEAVKSAQSGAGHSSQQVYGWMDAWAAGDKRPIPAPDIHRRK